jgi:hypothetical protein
LLSRMVTQNASNTHWIMGARMTLPTS